VQLPVVAAAVLDVEVLNALDEDEEDDDDADVEPVVVLESVCFSDWIMVFTLPVVYACIMVKVGVSPTK
jgi:hypothetical protein